MDGTILQPINRTDSTSVLLASVPSSHGSCPEKSRGKPKSSAVREHRVQEWLEGQHNIDLTKQHVNIQSDLLIQSSELIDLSTLKNTRETSLNRATPSIEALIDLSLQPETATNSALSLSSPKASRTVLL